METTVALLAKVRAGKLEDTVDTSLRVGEPGDPGSLRLWPPEVHALESEKAKF